MKIANIVTLCCVAATLAGCSAVQSVEFVAGSASYVLIDYDARPADEFQYTSVMAKEKCRLFDRPTAVLDRIDTRSDGRMRATYLCK